MASRHGLSSGAIFPAFSTKLIALGQSGQGIRYRHLAALIALEAHPLQDLAARQAVALSYQFEQRLLPAAAVRSRFRPAGACRAPYRSSPYHRPR